MARMGSDPVRARCPRRRHRSNTRSVISRSWGDSRPGDSIAGIPRSAGTGGGGTAAGRRTPMPHGCRPRRVPRHREPHRPGTMPGWSVAMRPAGWRSVRRVVVRQSCKPALRWPRRARPPRPGSRRDRRVGSSLTHQPHAAADAGQTFCGDVVSCGDPRQPGRRGLVRHCRRRQRQARHAVPLTPGRGRALQDAAAP